MRVYIAGPMTGYTSYNCGAFRYAARKWTAAGHEAVTPFEANSVVWQRHYGRDFDPTRDKCDYGDPILPEMFVEDLTALRGCDAVALLPGWERSRGARVEILMAEMFGKLLFDAETMQPVALTATVLIQSNTEST